MEMDRRMKESLDRHITGNYGKTSSETKQTS
jgi:hypothetical protein